jgi:Uma2 family endonuclease
VVSTSSRKRDYEQKPEEYLRFGVREYWIVDIQRREMTVLRRSRDKWVKRIVQPGKLYRTKLLPGFGFDLAAAFEAAEQHEK